MIFLLSTWQRKNHKELVTPAIKKKKNNQIGNLKKLH